MLTCYSKKQIKKIKEKIKDTASIILSKHVNNITANTLVEAYLHSLWTYDQFMGIYSKSLIDTMEVKISAATKTNLFISKTASKKFIYSKRDKGGVGITHPIVHFHKNFLINSLKMLNEDSREYDLGVVDNLFYAYKECLKINYSYEDSLNHYNKWIKFFGILKYLETPIELDDGVFYLRNVNGTEINNMELEGIIRKKFHIELQKRISTQDSITNYEVDDLSFSYWRNNRINQFEKKFFMQLHSGVVMSEKDAFNNSSYCYRCPLKEAPLKHTFLECMIINKQAIVATEELFQTILGTSKLKIHFTWEDNNSFKHGLAVSPRGAISPALGKHIKLSKNKDILVFKV